MEYSCVFWDIDGTLYDNSLVAPQNELDFLSDCDKLADLPDFKLDYFKPYSGLVDLISKIPKHKQGIITNGFDLLQKNKLFLLGLSDFFNSELIYSSYSEVEKILKSSNHNLLENFFMTNDFSTDLHNMTLRTQKPETYMFEQAVLKSGKRACDCLMVGDDWKDVLGSQKLGMKTIYVSGLPVDEYFDSVGDCDIVPDFIIEKGDITSLSNLLL